MSSSLLDNAKTLRKPVNKFRKRHYKEFLSKLGLQSIFPRIDKSPLFWKFMNLDIVYLDFIQDDFEMPPYQLKKMENFIQWYFYTYHYTIPGTDVKLSLYESIELSRRLLSAVTVAFSDNSKVAKTCAPWLERFDEYDIVDRSMIEYEKSLLLMAISYSSLENWLYTAKGSISKCSNDVMKMRFKVTIIRKKAEVYNRTGEFLRRYYLLEISSWSGEFETIQCSFEGETYPVYLQRHALKRVHERTHIPMNKVTSSILQNVSFKDIRTYKGKLLIPFYATVHRKSKVGYLLGEVYDNRLLINTFLFISQDGTPEGDKLNELLKVHKQEKEYLMMDELKHFTNSDLKDDTELRSILETCQLDHLFNLKINLPDIDFTQNADYIKSTLNLNAATTRSSF